MQLSLIIRHNINAVEQHSPRRGSIEANQVFEQGGFAAAASSQDHQDFTPVNREADPFEDNVLPKAGSESIHHDDRVLTGVFQGVSFWLTLTKDTKKMGFAESSLKSNTVHLRN
jgi:hypothetical protein